MLQRQLFKFRPGPRGRAELAQHARVLPHTKEFTYGCIITAVIKHFHSSSAQQPINSSVLNLLCWVEVALMFATQIYRKARNDGVEHLSGVGLLKERARRLGTRRYHEVPIFLWCRKSRQTQ